MQRVLGFLAIYSRLKNKRSIVTKTRKNNMGKFNWPPQYLDAVIHVAKEIIVIELRGASPRFVNQIDPG